MNFTTEKSFILASASPRRKELFERLNVPFKILVATVEETSIKDDNPTQYVKKVALLKATDVAKKNPGHVVIGADTIVVKGQELLHKPKDANEAIKHLKQLRGNVHEVMTAVAIIDDVGNKTAFVEKTEVYFKQVPDTLIEAYVATGDCFDKAGGYGIQTDGVFLVEGIKGDYLNVVGLPLARLTELLVDTKLISI
ncbi:Maf family protein [Rummeliibacillus stabekisii]|uniref:Maf family protein n=1 Tax=Rummeliibacillus stabekisii TaxID=241244 RepID=UPI00116711E2|nr:Maf family protein [Rummeliibacillus stabekisii]MBB5169140.1 septum formation protein [Rummeliibacillus stabekisii]GEL03402.1 septum formation protein Maf [Rummeliibacillus stabekisii]